MTELLFDYKRRSPERRAVFQAQHSRTYTVREIISTVWIHWVCPYQVCEIALVNIVPSFGCVFDCAVQRLVILLADFYLEPFICDPVESVWVCFISHSFIFQRFKKNTLQNRTISGPSPERSTRIAAVNAAPPVIHNHALSSNKPKSSIMSFSFCIFSLITLISITDFSVKSSNFFA